MENIFNEVIRKKALELLKRADLPTDPAKAEFRKTIFLKELESKKYVFENGEIIIQDSDGFPFQDRHGYNLNPDQFIESEFNRYFDKSDLPIDEAECLARLKDPKISPAERKRITDHWAKLKTK